MTIIIVLCAAKFFMRVRIARRGRSVQPMFQGGYPPNPLNDGGFNRMVKNGQKPVPKSIVSVRFLPFC